MIGGTLPPFVNVANLGLLKVFDIYNRLFLFQPLDVGDDNSHVVTTAITGIETGDRYYLGHPVSS